MIVLDQSGQQNPGEKALAGTGGAEDARRALHKFIQADADRMPLLAGGADLQIAGIGFRAKDGGDIQRLCQSRIGMVRRNRLDRKQSDVSTG